MATLDELYSPSKWAKLPPSEAVPQHVKVTSDVSIRAKQHIPCSLNVSYGALEDQKYDIFGIDLPDDAPIFVYIHGGYWQKLHRNICSYAVEPLYKNKIKTIVLGFTLCPKTTLGDIIEEILAGFLKSVASESNRNARKISIGGHCAGAHLAVTLFQDLKSLNIEVASKIDGLYLISGLYDLIPLLETHYNDLLQLNETTSKKLSPLYNYKKMNTNTKFFIIHAEHDSSVFKEQSNLFFNRLEELDIITELMEMPDEDHFTIVEKLSTEDYHVTQLIIQSLAKE